MIDVIYKIKNSQPTLVAEQAADLFAGIVSRTDWVVASSAIFPMEELLQYIDYYLTSLARVEIHGESLLTIQPIHILYVDNTLLQDDWSKMWGLLYSNGAVCYSEKEDGTQFMILFIDETLVDENDIVELKIKTDPV
jgi:hypothetical protein